MHDPTQTPQLEGSASADAIEMLKQDHREIERLFDRIESLRGGTHEERTMLIRRLCDELDVHAALEEEIFYPAAAQATGAVDLVDHARHEHGEAKRLAARLRDLSPDDADTDLRRLRKIVEAHVHEEEERLFTEARGRLDGVALAAQMGARRQVLQTQIAGTGRDTRPA